MIADDLGAEVDERPAAPSAPPPHRWSLGSAVAGHPFLVLLPLVLLLAAGVVVGHRRAVTYSSSATIIVGSSAISAQASPGYVNAAEALAANYSRLVDSQHITVPTARRLHLPVGSVSSRLSSTSVSDEPTIDVTAKGASSGSASKLLNAAIAELRDYVAHTQTQTGSVAHLLAQYTQFETQANDLKRTAGMLAHQLAEDTPGITQQKVTNAQVASQTAALQAQALSSQYLVLSESGTPTTLSVLHGETGPSTNRTSNMEKFGALGGVAGLIIGIAFAALISGVGHGRLVRAAPASR